MNGEVDNDAEQQRLKLEASRKSLRRVSVSGHQFAFEGWLHSVSANTMSAIIELESGELKVCEFPGATIKLLS